MAFPYRHVPLIGATSGIGKAMADRLIEAGAKVTVVGRRIGWKSLRVDMAKVRPELPLLTSFHLLRHSIVISNDSAMHVSPDIDCVFLNAGVQHCYHFSQPEKVDLAEFHSEMSVNFSSFVDLTHAFLPFLLSKKSETSIIYTGYNLVIIPAAILPAYSASKAALNAFVLCLRDQLRATNVQVVELSPPPVQTELHDVEMGEEAGRRLGMPLNAFTFCNSPEGSVQLGEYINLD